MNKFLSFLSAIKSNNFCLVFYFIFAFFNKSNAQTIFISPGNDTAICRDELLTLTANFPPFVNVNLEQGIDLGYDVSSIPFAPADSLGTPVNLLDDQESIGLPIGFNFNFFGTNYSQFRISPNGWIGFIPPLASYFNMNLEIIDANQCSDLYPNTGIFGVLYDFNPMNNGNIIRYQTIGNEPNRKLIVSFNSIPFFSAVCGANATFQIHLFETSNMVEVHIANKPLCNQWANSIRTGICAPIPTPCPGVVASCSVYGYSGNDIAFSDTAWRYAPRIADSTEVASMSSLKWTLNGSTSGITNPSNYSIPVSIPFGSSPVARYVLTVEYLLPCVIKFTYKDTVVISLKPFDATFNVTSPICVNDSVLFTFNGSPSPTSSGFFNWNFDGGVATPGTGIGPHIVTYSEAGFKNVSLSISSNLCALGTYTTTFQVDTCATSNLVKNNSPFKFTIFPNPSNGNFNINIDQLGNYQLKIYNSVGQLIKQASIGSGNSTINLKTQNISSGLYILEITNEQQQRLKIEKLVVDSQ